MILYLIEFSALFAFFGLIYLVFLRKEGNYNFLRSYLLLSTLLSILLPFAPSVLLKQGFTFGALLPEVELIAGQNANAIATVYANEWGLLDWSILLYVLVTLFMMGRLGLAMFHLFRIQRGGIAKWIGDKEIILSDKIKFPCSFLSKIYIPIDHNFDQEQLKTIIAHEALHIELQHSYEKIFLELCKALIWWHPSSWLYSREINLIHEYQVDEYMLLDQKETPYIQTLLNLALAPVSQKLVHPLSSNIKQRLNVMNQKKKKTPALQFAILSLLLIGGSFMIHSCTAEEAKNENISTMSAKVDTRQAEVSDTIVTFDIDTGKETMQIVRGKNDYFVEAEQMPMFPGCDNTLDKEALDKCSKQKLLQYVYTNIKYPEEAKNKEIEGMVLAKFVIDKSGKMITIDIVKTPGGGLEDQVSKMLDKMSDEITWIPGMNDGKIVSVQYTLPVKFKLEG